MPIFSRFWRHEETGIADPDTLMSRGPSLSVEISVHEEFAAILEQEGTSIPQPQTGLALIDTGASITAIDQTVVDALGLIPLGIITVSTPSGQEDQLLYPCRIEFPGTPIGSLNFNRVTGSKLSEFGIATLIGRDLLRHFLLVYNGFEGYWTLAY